VLQRDETYLNAASLKAIAANGFRVLGVSGSASQSDITMAARRMRIWPDEKNIPPTAWDFPWVGPLSRSQTALQQAVARLGEPTTRIADRLLWYAGEQPPKFTSSPTTPEELARASPAECHCLAVGALHRALVQDPTVKDIDRWRNVTQGLIDWCGSVGCTEWMIQVEASGGFDKGATQDEIISAICSLPSAVGSWATSAAMAALDFGRSEQCAKILEMVQGFEAIASTVDSGALGDRLEDQIIEACAKIDAQLRPVLRTIHSQPQKNWVANFAATQVAADQYARSVDPALRQMVSMSANDPSRVDRAKTEAANLLVLIGLGWEWSGRFILAEKTLADAVELTATLPGNAKTRQTCDRLRLLAIEQRNSRRSRLFGRKTVSPLDAYLPRAVRAKSKQRPKSSPRQRVLLFIGISILSALWRGGCLSDTPEPAPYSDQQIHELLPSMGSHDRNDAAPSSPSNTTATPQQSKSYDKDLVAPDDPIGETNREK
jgi:hypothetical protein